MAHCLPPLRLKRLHFPLTTPVLSQPRQNKSSISLAGKIVPVFSFSSLSFQITNVRPPTGELRSSRLRDFPLGVFGPVESRAFRRLATTFAGRFADNSSDIRNSKMVKAAGMGTKIMSIVE